MGLSIFADPSPDVTPLPIEAVLLHLKPFDEDAALRCFLFIYYALFLLLICTSSPLTRTVP
jgi:hypothetical protein